MDKMVQPWRSGRIQGDYTINNPTITCGSLGKVAGLGGQEFKATNKDAVLVTDLKAAVEVKEATEVNTPDRHPRPLTRACERHKVRLAQQEAQRWAEALRRAMDVPDDHVGNCKMCNEKIPESDWSNYTGLGWDVHLISHCMTCLEFAMNDSTSLELCSFQ